MVGSPRADRSPMKAVMVYLIQRARCGMFGYRMAQKDLQFAPAWWFRWGRRSLRTSMPYAIVYSFSADPSNKLRGRDETRHVKFDKPGVVAVGCNIHDDMSAYIRSGRHPLRSQDLGQWRGDDLRLAAGVAAIASGTPI